MRTRNHKNPRRAGHTETLLICGGVILGVLIMLALFQFTDLKPWLKALPKSWSLLPLAVPLACIAVGHILASLLFWLSIKYFDWRAGR